NGTRYTRSSPFLYTRSNSPSKISGPAMSFQCSFDNGPCTITYSTPDTFNRSTASEPQFSSGRPSPVRTWYIRFNAVRFVSPDSNVPPTCGNRNHEFNRNRVPPDANTRPSGF